MTVWMAVSCPSCKSTDLVRNGKINRSSNATRFVAKIKNVFVALS
ncbi:IS1 family transposase [Pleurocapsa sp. FMAR1]